MKISKYINISIFAILFVSVFLFVPQNVEAVATTRTVCPDPVGSCSPSDPSFVGASGVAAAITASVDGDTVSIKNGTYSGFTKFTVSDYDYLVNLNKNVNIVGESKTGTILSGAGTDKGTILLIRTTANVSISNLTLSTTDYTCPGTPCSYGNGIEVNSTAGTVSISNINITGTERQAIWNGGTSVTTLNSCDLSVNYGGLYTSDTSALTVSNCNIYGNINYGAFVSENSNLVISNSTIYNNVDGIWYFDNSTGTVSSSVIRNNTSDGVTVDDASIIAVNNNQIYSNANVGLRLFKTSQTTGTGNTIYSNLYTGHASGVFCSESAVLGTWTNNNVWNNANGNYGSDPVGLCTDKTGTNGNISVDPQSLISSSTSSSPTLPDTALGNDSFLKIFIAFLAICLGIIFLSRHFALIVNIPD